MRNCNRSCLDICRGSPPESTQRPLTGCPVAVRRCRRRPATCVPGTRPARRFKSGGVASNGRLLTRPVALPRAARLGSRARKNAGTEREHRTVQAAHPDHTHAHAHMHDAAAARTYTTQGGWVGGWASRWVIARSPRPPPQRTRPRSTNELHSPRAAAARHTPPSHTDTPTTPTHTHTTQPPHAHARRGAGRWAWRWAVCRRSGVRGGVLSCGGTTFLCVRSRAAVRTRERRATGRRGRRGQRGGTGRVGRRPFDATPPGLNRGAGLVPGTQVAGGGRAAAKQGTRERDRGCTFL